jgi:hypothetical protein
MASLMNFIDVTVNSCHCTNIGLNIMVPCHFCDPDVYCLTYAQESIRSIIGVSTPCCLTCWELIDILRREPTDFTIRNCHATLSQVQLPSWIPRDVMMKMLDRFRHLLLLQIAIMMGKQDRTAQDSSRQRQSVSGSRERPLAFDSLYSGSESDVM